jgi:hypothetical protein
MLKESLKAPLFTDGFRLSDLLCQSYPPHVWSFSNSQYSFQLELYENGAPAPTLLQPEVPVADASPFLLTDPEFSKIDVVKAYAHTIVAPAIDYWIKTIDIKKGDEVAHFKELAYSIPFMLWSTRFLLLTLTIRIFSNSVIIHKLGHTLRA